MENKYSGILNTGAAHLETELIIQQQILRLEVAMRHPSAVTRLQTSDELVEVRARNGLLKTTGVGQKLI